MPSATVTVTVGKVMSAITRIVGQVADAEHDHDGDGPQSGGMPWKKSTAGFSSASAPRHDPIATPAAAPAA